VHEITFCMKSHTLTLQGFV